MLYTTHTEGNTSNQTSLVLNLLLFESFWFLCLLCICSCRCMRVLCARGGHRSVLGVVSLFCLLCICSCRCMCVYVCKGRVLGMVPQEPSTSCFEKGSLIGWRRLLAGHGNPRDPPVCLSKTGVQVHNPRPGFFI